MDKNPKNKQQKPQDIKSQSSQQQENVVEKPTVSQKPVSLKQRVAKKVKYLTSKKRFWFIGLPLVLIIFLYFFIFKDLPTPYDLANYHSSPRSTQILDRNGKLLYNIFTEENRIVVPLEAIPIYLRQATIAVEDKDFYKHKGVDPIGGIVRAGKEFVVNQKIQGGSTLTQQLIRSALLTQERTVQRKLREMILALWAESIYDKDKILEMYLNQVPYGGTAWGIQSASKNYFGKDVKDLTLAQSALLAGLTQAPTRYSPFGANPDLAIDRQHQVLKRMVEEGYITEEEAENAKKEDLQFKPPSKEDVKAPHFVFYIKQQLVDKYGEKMVEQGGMKVTTTLDIDIQEEAQKIVNEEIGKLTRLRVGNGAALVTKPRTGEILAMVGSYDYFATGSGNVNVTTALRQPGSSIKPINYATGIELKKVTAATPFNDEPTCFEVPGQPLYCPKNYDGSFHGPVQLRFALANSYNIPAVKQLAINGLRDMIATASAMGIDTFQDPSRYGLSLTLGGGEVRMTDMAEAFGVFANTGIRKDLMGIIKVEDGDGNILEEVSKDKLEIDSPLLIEGPRVLSPETSYIISHILLDNGARSQAFGSGSLLNIPGQAVSVKTGTTDDLKDNWTIGFTPEYLTAVWVGNNDGSAMNPALVSGVTGAAPIWNKIMTFILKDKEALWPILPAGVVGKTVCAVSGKLPPPGDSGQTCPQRFEYFVKGTEPTDVENLKTQVIIDKENGMLARPGKTDNVETQEKSVITDPFGLYCLDCTQRDSSHANIIKSGTATN